MERYVIRGGRLGFERLQLLARSWSSTTSALLDRVGIEPGMTCLDLGSGAGDVALELAERVGPDGHVTAIDMDEVKLQLAQEIAESRSLAHVDFKRLDVYDWAPSAEFDVTYCRFLLQHLTRPVDVLRAMWDGLRPGGVIVVEDVDFDGCFCEPPNEGYDFWVSRYEEVLRGNGGDPLAGRKLHRYFQEADIPAPEIAVAQRAHVTGEAKSLPHSTLEATADAMLSTGVATEEEIGRALASLAALAHDTTSLCGSPRLFQAWARR